MTRRTSYRVPLDNGPTCPSPFRPVYARRVTGEQENSKPWSQIFLGLVAVLLFGCAVVGSLKGLHAAVAIFLVIAGGGLAILAAFWSRVQGPVGFTRDGFSIPINAANRAEKQIEQGRLVDENKLEAASKALEEALSRYNTSRVGTPTVTQGPPSAPTNRSVALVDDAVVTMATLDPREHALVRNEIARMSRSDFREEDDPRAIRAGDQGRSYRVHNVPNSNLRLWYRPLSEHHPDRLVVMVIEKKG